MADQRTAPGPIFQARSSELIVLDYPGPQARDRIKSAAVDTWGSGARYLLDEIRPRELSLRTYATILAERIGWATEPRAIVGYCASAEIAREIEAVYFERTGRHVKIVLINPVTPSLEEAVLMAQEIIGVAGGTPSTEVTRTSEKWLERFERTLARCYATGLGLSPSDADVLGGLVEMQSDWVAHLLAASQGRAAPSQDGEVHVLSNGYGCATGCAADHVLISTTHEHMFECRDFLAAMLEHAADRGPRRELHDEPRSGTNRTTTGGRYEAFECAEGAVSDVAI